MKKLFLLGLTVAIATSLQAAGKNARKNVRKVANNQPFELNVAHSNDHHSQLEQERMTLKIDGKDVTLDIGGLPRVGQEIKDFRKNNKNTLILHAGDAVTGTLYYTLFKGIADAELMNVINFDAFTLGNHEFDDGNEVLAKFLSALKIPVISSNVVPDKGSILEGKWKPYIIKNVGGEKIGIIGMEVVKKTVESSSPGKDIKFIDDNSGYFDLFTGEFILFSESKESFKIQSGLKSDANCDNANQSQYEGNELLDGYSKGENNNFFSNSSEIYEQDYIYEERELKDAGPINDFIIGNKSIPVKIEIDSFSSINLKIIDEVINKLCQKNLSREDIFVSRSKSYIQDTKDGFKYNWRSWNVLPKEAIEKEKQIYIFSIQLDKNDNTNFTCVVFENEKLRNLLKSKRLTPDDRYYFYFASKKIS